MKPPYLFLIGDSIALHYTEAFRQFLDDHFEIGTRQGYREAIQNLDHPRGANCGDSSMVLTFLEEVVLRQDRLPDWVVLNCGLHDIKTDPATGQRQVSELQYAANLDQIFARLSDRKIRTTWIQTTPVPDDRHRKLCPEVWRFERDVLAYNAIAAERAAAWGIPRIDLHDFTAKLGSEVYIDHVHYTESARQLQAAFLSGALIQERELKLS